MKQVMCLLGILGALAGNAQPDHQPPENGYMRTACYSQHGVDAFSFTGNAACLGQIQFAMGGVITERKWMLQELGAYEIAASFALKQGGAGVDFSYAGDGNYHEAGVRLAYGKQLGRVSIGADFNYLQADAAGYPGGHFGFAEFGMICRLNEKLIAGWQFGLPVLGAGRSIKERGAWLFSMGLGYELRPDLVFAFVVTKTAGRPVNLITSVDYQYTETFFFSVGLNSSNTAPYFKTGWRSNRCTIELYSCYEAVLGFSPGLALLWTGRHKKN